MAPTNWKSTSSPMRRAGRRCWSPSSTTSARGLRALLCKTSNSCLEVRAAKQTPNEAQQRLNQRADEIGKRDVEQRRCGKLQRRIRREVRFADEPQHGPIIRQGGEEQPLPVEPVRARAHRYLIGDRERGRDAQGGDQTEN